MGHHAACLLNNGSTPKPRESYSQVLHHDVLVRDEAVHAVVTPLPPVLRGPQVQQERGSLLEGQLPRTPAHVVELGDGLNLLHFCATKDTKPPALRQPSGSMRLVSCTGPDCAQNSPSSLVLGPLSTSSRAPGSLWGLSLRRKKHTEKQTCELMSEAAPTGGFCSSCCSSSTDLGRDQGKEFQQRLSETDPVSQ